MDIDVIGKKARMVVYLRQNRVHSGGGGGASGGGGGSRPGKPPPKPNPDDEIVVDAPQNVVSDVLNHDIGADIVVLAKKVPQPVQNFISDWVIDYNCGFIDSSSCGVSDYISAGLLVSGACLAGNTAIEGPKAALFKYGKGRAGQIRFFEDRLIFRLDVNKPITDMNIRGRMFGVTFNIHFPKW